jgi:hypothetical protein
MRGKGRNRRVEKIIQREATSGNKPTTKTIKSRRMKWAGHESRMMEMRNA